MTERDKAAIERMRRNGLSYQEIAGNLAISKEAVRHTAGSMISLRTRT